MSGGLPVDKIVVASGRRTPDAERIRSLSGSIAELGLLNPITVVPDRKPGLYQLLAGLHRLEACKALGWKRVPANVVEHSELYGELVEIDENLIRFELSALERATATARRKEIFEALHPETKAGAIRARASNKKQDKATGSDVGAESASTFVTDTASKTGRSARAVQVDAQIGAKLTAEEITKLKGTPAEDNQRELLSIAREKDPEKRERKVQAAVAPKPKAPPAPPADAAPQQPKPPARSQNPIDFAQQLWLDRIPAKTRAAVLELHDLLESVSEFQRMAFWAWAKGNDA